MSDNDDVLIAQIRQRDRSALAEYIRLKQAQLLGFIEKRLSDGLSKKVDSSDILQDVSMSCINALDQVDLSQRDPFSWLCQQAERRIIDEHRKHFGAQKRAAHREVAIHGISPNNSGSLEDMLAASFTTPSEALSKARKEYHLLSAINELPVIAQTAIKLRYMQGLASKDIAERIGKSDAATRVLLSRSLKRLQELLFNNDEFQTLVEGLPESEKESGLR